MKRDDFHLSDEQMLSDIDGELSADDRKQVRSHFDVCWKCRTRRHELENAIAGFVHLYEQEFNNDRLPSTAGSRALLKARLEQVSAESIRPSGRFHLARLLPWALPVGLCAMLAFAWLPYRSVQAHYRRYSSPVVSVPRRSITPGAALLVNGPTVCAADGSNNKTVPVALQRRVLEEYGLAGADPRMYEIDYLVTPGLGGSDDIRNLWPHSYASTVWNAKVKDALEERLRERVCQGDMDLTTAQREIAGNWIAAYQKYFETETPLPEHEK